MLQILDARLHTGERPRSSEVVLLEKIGLKPNAEQG